MSEDHLNPDNWQRRFYPPYDDPSYNKDGWHIAHWFGDKRHFRPWYDDDADYNTNAKSYYDYLGFRLAQFEDILNAINHLLRRNINVSETNSVKLTKEGDWSSTDIITLRALAKISNRELNALQALDDGLYCKNLKPQIDRLQEQVNNLETRVSNVENLAQKHDRVLRKILQSLSNNGSWHSDGDILDGDFVQGHGVASGTINLFGGTQDGSSYIRTNGGHTENDLTGGI